MYNINKIVTVGDENNDYKVLLVSMSVLKGFGWKCTFSSIWSYIFALKNGKPKHLRITVNY